MLRRTFLLASHMAVPASEDQCSVQVGIVEASRLVAWRLKVVDFLCQWRGRVG